MLNVHHNAYTDAHVNDYALHINVTFTETSDELHKPARESEERQTVSAHSEAIIDQKVNELLKNNLSADVANF